MTTVTKAYAAGSSEIVEGSRVRLNPQALDDEPWIEFDEGTPSSVRVSGRLISLPEGVVFGGSVRKVYKNGKVVVDKIVVAFPDGVTLEHEPHVTVKVETEAIRPYLNPVEMVESKAGREAESLDRTITSIKKWLDEPELSYRTLLDGLRKALTPKIKENANLADEDRESLPSATRTIEGHAQKLVRAESRLEWVRQSGALSVLIDLKDGTITAEEALEQMKTIREDACQQLLTSPHRHNCTCALRNWIEEEKSLAKYDVFARWSGFRPEYDLRYHIEAVKKIANDW
jgi:hypothetical protein